MGDCFNDLPLSIVDQKFHVQKMLQPDNFTMYGIYMEHCADAVLSWK